METILPEDPKDLFPILQKRVTIPIDPTTGYDPSPRTKRLKTVRDDDADEWHEESPLTPKQKRQAAAKKKREEAAAAKQEKDEERERIRAEKQQKQEEEKKVKEIEKQRKEAEKQEKLRQKEEERQKKEEEKKKREQERQEKKERLEAEKQEKLQQKEEEKKRKEEERQEKQKLKEEEKEKKRLEKEVREAEAIKKKAEEQRKAEEKQKSLSQLWTKMGVKKVSTPDLSAIDSPRRKVVTVKQGLGTLVLAPTMAPKMVSVEEMDAALARTWTTEQITNLFRTTYTKDIFPRQKRPMTPLHKSHPKLSAMKAIYFGNRPPFYATFSKKSTLIRPRRPFVKDESHFDYEIDSDEEWEEGGCEDLANASDDEQNGIDAMDTEEYDEFLVPDGYFSDEEGIGCQTPGRAIAGHSHSHSKPICTGLLYSSSAFLDEYTVLPIGRIFPLRNDELEKAALDSKATNKLLRPVPEDSIPDLIRLLHNSTDGVAKITAQFKILHPNTSKRQVEIKMKELATKNGGKWQLNDQELRLKYCPDETKVEETPKEIPVSTPTKPKKRIQPISLDTIKPKKRIQPIVVVAEPKKPETPSILSEPSPVQ